MNIKGKARGPHRGRGDVPRADLARRASAGAADLLHHGAVTERIVAEGHEIGLHFDAAAHDVTDWSRDPLLTAIDRERTLLEQFGRTNLK